MKQYIVDAFAEELFSGNPAAVLPCRTMPTAELMLSIARENNYSETAFAVKRAPGEYDLKWFTPGGEIDLCGHATLATAFVMYHYADRGNGIMRFHTSSGILTVTRDGDGFTLYFPMGKVKPVPLTEDIRTAAGGMALEAWFDGGDMVVVVADERELETFQPDAKQIAEIDGLGFILTARSKRFDFVSRCFYPKLQVTEDPVTGRAHTYLAPVWARKLQKTAMRAKQISARGGIMTVAIKDDRVFLTGGARLFMQGDIPFDL